ncbi:MAG: response regulator [Agathobacter sp.]|nr:response regulator [Agathobacter sp.]
MRILAVDDEKLMLERLVRCITEAVPQAEVVSFQKATECLAYAMKEQVDVAFLDIRMRMMDGMELARQIKLLQPKINIIFTTGYSDYIYDAVSEIRCSGYVLKPVTTEQIRRELDNLRHPIEQQSGAKVHMQCFGNFEVFVDGKVLPLKPEKMKELLAYLVDRKGALCSNSELLTVLWEDGGDHYDYLKKCKKSLVAALDEAGCKDVLVSKRGSIGVDKDAFSCDYYDWIEGKPSGINAYQGQYMTQYSWGEITNASLTQNNK